MNTNEQRWPNLNNLTGCCFHEDMDDEYPASSYRESARLAVEDFFCTQPIDQVTRARVELKELLATTRSEDDLTSSLEELHIPWDFSPWRPWLESLLAQIDNFLGRAASASRIRGLPSDPIAPSTKPSVRQLQKEWISFVTRTKSGTFKNQ